MPNRHIEIIVGIKEIQDCLTDVAAMLMQAEEAVDAEPEGETAEIYNGLADFIESSRLGICQRKSALAEKLN